MIKNDAKTGTYQHSVRIVSKQCISAVIISFCCVICDMKSLKRFQTFLLYFVLHLCILFNLLPLFYIGAC